MDAADVVFNDGHRVFELLCRVELADLFLAEPDKAG